jgi:hypothetical protein
VTSIDDEGNDIRTAVPPVPEPYVNRFELAIRADLEVIKAQPSQDEESQ